MSVVRPGFDTLQSHFNCVTLATRSLLAELLSAIAPPVYALLSIGPCLVRSSHICQAACSMHFRYLPNLSCLFRDSQPHAFDLTIRMYLFVSSRPWCLLSQLNHAGLGMARPSPPRQHSRNPNTTQQLPSGSDQPPFESSPHPANSLWPRTYHGSNLEHGRIQCHHG